MIGAGGQYSSDVSADFKDTVFRALRVAPDTELVSILQAHGWTGLMFRNLEAVAVDLLGVLMQLNCRSTSENGAVFHEDDQSARRGSVSSRSSAESPVSRRAMSADGVDDGTGRGTRSGSFSEKKLAILPSIFGRPSSRSASTKDPFAGSVSKERSPHPPRRPMRRSTSSSFARPANRVEGHIMPRQHSNGSTVSNPRPLTRAGLTDASGTAVTATHLEAKLNRLRSGRSPITHQDGGDDDRDDVTPPASPVAVLLTTTEMTQNRSCNEDYRRASSGLPSGRRRTASVGSTSRPARPPHPNTIQSGSRTSRRGVPGH